MSGRRQNADIADTLHLSMGYNLSCMIASDTLFDSRGGFLGSSYRMKTTDFEVVRDLAMATVLAFYTCTLAPPEEYD